MKNSLKRLATIILERIRQHSHFIIYVLAYMIALIAVCAWLGTYHMISFDMYEVLPLTAVLFFAAVLLGRYLNMALVTRPRPLLPHMRADLKALFEERFLTGLPILLLLPVFMSAFTAFKSLIPVMNPYTWDPALYRLEELLHGGYQPWELLMPLLGYPVVTLTINFIYAAWLFTMFVVVYWQAFSLSNPVLRMQFFLSFVLCWSLLGSGVATIFSSAGPCFYERLLGLDAYQGLMQYLQSVDEQHPVWALSAQDMLWKLYELHKLALGSGISALPSMHVSSALLFALVGVRTHWVPGVALSIFFLFILVGSVHLGWHYAVDGYVAIILTLILWRLAGIWAGRLPLAEDKILD